MRADDLPDSIKKLNPQLFARPSISPQKNAKDEGEGVAMGKIPSATKPLEIDEKNARLNRMPKLNKTEMRFFRDCLADADGVVIAQPTRFFRLSGGGTYTPDFILIHECGMTVYEVKAKGAHYPGWEQGIERYKRVAYEFSSPFLRFVMVIWDRKEGRWITEEFEK